MARERELIHLRPEERLRESPRQATSLALPLAVHRRLDLLAEAAAAVDASRSEIIGMLLAEADLEPESLERQIIAYRKMKVGDALPPSEGGHEAVPANVISFEKRPPGRPARR